MPGRSDADGRALDRQLAVGPVSPTNTAGPQEWVVLPERTTGRARTEMGGGNGLADFQPGQDREVS